MDINFSQPPASIKTKNKRDLAVAILIFRMVRYRWLIRAGELFLPCILWIPGVKPLIRRTIFKHFCGGETLDDARTIVADLAAHRVNAISDYSAEQADTEEKQETTQKNILESIRFAGEQRSVPFACVKITGICARPLLEKASRNATLTAPEQRRFAAFRNRLDALCAAAAEQGKKLFIDAEETWINPAIDAAAEAMMQKYNRDRQVVYTTLQLYRRDGLDYLQRLITTADYKIGLKLVRGAYHEQENERAARMGYPSPVLPSKSAVDQSYNDALRLCIRNLDKVSFCAATHNAESTELLIRLMEEFRVAPDSQIVSFSQLYGMRDNITYELAGKGYNVSKYIPYGPLKETLPYLIRRAQENAGVSSQMGEELQMLLNEKRRRKRRR